MLYFPSGFARIKTAGGLVKPEIAIVASFTAKGVRIMY